MLKVWSDFNAMTPEDECWILIFKRRDLADQMDELGLKKGDTIILYQDPDDFEVTASLDFGQVSMAGREVWFARPDWTTRADGPGTGDPDNP